MRDFFGADRIDFVDMLESLHMSEILGYNAYTLPRE